MKVKNNANAPQLRINWKHLFLVGLHFIVFVLSAFSQSYTTVELTTGALP